MNTSVTTLTYEDDTTIRSIPTTLSFIGGNKSSTTRRLSFESGIPRPPSQRINNKATVQLLKQSCPNVNSLMPLLSARPNALLHADLDYYDHDTTNSSIASDSIYYDEYDDDDDISTIFPGLVIYGNSSSVKYSGGESKSSGRGWHFLRGDEKSVYLAKCSLLDFPLPTSTGSLLSGWVAYSHGDSLLHKRKIVVKHLAYLVVNEDETSIHLKQPPSLSSSKIKNKAADDDNNDDNNDICIPLPPHTKCQTIDSACGRCVVLLTSSKIICTLLPVHVPTTQSKQQDMKKQDHLATRSSVAQHDAALHLWFGLDGWLHRAK
mmetsp:Transcript_5930/g.6487  ORF Transcript_5930/g.6487 Transcript_5930/m.6487 type:complete len:320 (+) Transcript_5930:1-960(+)